MAQKRQVLAVRFHANVDIANQPCGGLNLGRKQGTPVTTHSLEMEDMGIRIVASRHGDTEMHELIVPYANITRFDLVKEEKIASVAPVKKAAS